MQNDKYGFVYIWRDRKHKRYYIGCRWGHEDDGYVCSSRWMRNTYKRRPNDFKRRILSRITTNKKDLLEEEYRWFQMIKKEELGTRYYNMSIRHFGHWTANSDARSIGEKISASHKADPNWGSWGKGKVIPKETRIRISNKLKSLGKRPDISAGMKKRWQDPEYRAKTTASHVGKKQSQKTKDKRIATNKERGHKTGFKPGHICSDEEKAFLSSLFKGKHWKLVNGKRVWY